MVITLRAHKSSILSKPLLDSWQKNCRLLRCCDGARQQGTVKTAIYGQKNNFLAEEMHQYGTIDHTPVYPREIVQRALELGADAIVLAYNHPSGDCRPSSNDIVMTQRIV